MAQSQVHPSRQGGFILSRWRRQVPLGLMFWRDMIVFGTLLNLATTFAGLMALGFKVDGLTATLIAHGLPLPYNIFIAACVWRTADLADARAASSARFGAAAWLLLALII
jgi:hypothetical protein